MKKISFLLFYCVTGVIFWSCSDPVYPEADQIAVKWKVISNVYADKPGVKSQFTIENNSNFTFNATNWAMFYNQAPRGFKGTDSKIKIIHISGDWHKMVPIEGFTLKPGEKAEITYETGFWFIKESDAPQGPYIVFYDSKGEEKKIISLANFTVEPFTNPEQINRHLNDQVPIPTAAFNYMQNLSLTEVADSKLPALIPTPLTVKPGKGKITFDTAPVILFEKGLETEARYTAAFLGQISGNPITPIEALKPEPNSIYLSIRPLKVSGTSKESYRLEIKKNKSVVVTGSDPAGVFYGIQSLISLLPPEIFTPGETVATLQELVIEDAPRFSFRGLHIDVGRNFQSKETIKKMVDLMAFYKLNYMMLYLSEDEGWRIDIEELPELVSVGSYRGHTTKEATDFLHPSYGSGPFVGMMGSTGSGYYTREDFKEIITYANQRHISVIPTINLPGHSRAAIKAMEARYAKFMREGDEQKANEFRLIDPQDTSKYSSAQAYNDNVVCVARESVYKFYETVIDDIIEMYEEAGVPLEYFHTGGDEVPEGAWSGSPLCRGLMQTLPAIKDPKNLQSYFLRKVVDFMENKNIKLGGWEEVALLKGSDGKYAPNPEFIGKNVIPWVWNDQGIWADLAYRVANAGYPVVLCNVNNFYFDLAYNKDPKEPGLYWGGFCDVRNAWQFAPLNAFVTNLRSPMGKELNPETTFANMERLLPAAQKNIIGLQAQLWGETVHGPDMLEYYALPKLIGFAETAWGKARPWENEADPIKRKQQMDQGWNIFANMMAKKELPRLNEIFGGYNYRIPVPGGIIEEGMMKANVEYPGLSIRYTADGTEPTVHSPLYTKPVKAEGEYRLKAFDAAGKSSRTVSVKK